MVKTRAVIFDMWDTLIYNEQKNNIMRMLSNLLGIKLIRENWKRMEEAFMVKRYNKIGDAARDIKRYFHVESPRITEKLAEMARDSIKPEIFPDVIPALKRLEGYKLGLVSNTMSFNIESLNGRLFNHFDAVCLSCDVGLLKPDPRIFRTVLDKLDVEPGEAIMFGDNFKDDIEPSGKLGMGNVLVKRDNDMLTWREPRDYRRTIKSLSEVERFVK